MADDPREPLIAEFYRKLITLTEALRDAMHQSYPDEPALQAQIAHEIAFLCAHIQRRTRAYNAALASEVTQLERLLKQE